MNNLDMLNLIVGFFLPPLIAIVQQSTWPNSLRAIVTFVISLGTAVIVLYVQSNGHLDWHEWITSALTILVAAIATYHGFWKPTVAPGIERATNLG